MGRVEGVKAAKSTKCAFCDSSVYKFGLCGKCLDDEIELDYMARKEREHHG